MKSTIPLKEILLAIDKKDRKFYKRLSPELKKSFSPWLMMRFASSCTDRDYAPYCITLVNELVNYQFADIKDKELQWLLFTAAGLGTTQNHIFIKGPNARKKKSKAFNFLANHYPSMKIEDVELMLKLNTISELKKFAVDLGYTDREIKEIFGK